MTKIRALYLCLCNDLRGVNFEEMDGYEGYIIRDASTGVAMYTAYCADQGYSVYRAWMDEAGYDLADEKPLLLQSELFSVVSRIKADAGMCDPFLPVDCGRAYAYGHAARAALAKGQA